MKRCIRHAVFTSLRSLAFWRARIATDKPPSYAGYVLTEHQIRLAYREQTWMRSESKQGR